MMKNYKIQLFLLIISFSIFSCDRDETLITQPSEEKAEIIKFSEIQLKVEESLKNGKTFDWREQSTHMIFSAGMHADSVFSIGYTINSAFDIEHNIQDININSPEWLKVRTKVEQVILNFESKARGKTLTMKDLEPFGKVTFFPQIIIHTSNESLLEELRAMEEIRFVEPLGFSITDKTIAVRSDSGCEGDPNYSINSQDYTTVSPAAKVPWNFYNHNVNTAWNNSTKGDNVKVCIIDTGSSDNQDNLGSQFNSGNSNGRTLQRLSTKYSGSWWWRSLDPPHDPCGHGTSMAGQAASPWSNDGNSLGVAYQSNLMTIRAVEDVIISNSNERAGVRDALYLAGNSDVKVISMSIGTPFYSSTVADGVFYAYNKGKLMFAAAGTSLPWTSWYPVIFPANMSQCVAVTGVKDASSLQKCETCHSGPEVDFIIIMERAVNTDRHSVALATYSSQPKYIGGSSAATSTLAGIATMVWGENTSASRTSVMNALKNASSIYPSRHPDFGWGLVDANIAVGNL